jgi:tRNA(Arg) A34 adenosine deaminase TadA
MVARIATATRAGTRVTRAGSQTALDEERMAALAAFTARTLKTDRPVPFGSSIVHTRRGETLLRALNAVAREFDPSSHAEVRAIRLATKKLKNVSLAGYTLYTTCEPCPMCMSTALWAGLDRVVYGATIEDANRHCRQIQVPATEVAERSDMRCIVDGPILREQCYALFTHPKMLRAFRTWPTRKANQQLPATVGSKQAQSKLRIGTHA